MASVLYGEAATAPRERLAAALTAKPPAAYDRTLVCKTKHFGRCGLLCLTEMRDRGCNKQVGQVYAGKSAPAPAAEAHRLFPRAVFDDGSKAILDARLSSNDALTIRTGLVSRTPQPRARAHAGLLAQAPALRPRRILLQEGNHTCPQERI
jgi:hypothetical protein